MWMCLYSLKEEVKGGVWSLDDEWEEFWGNMRRMVIFEFVKMCLWGKESEWEGKDFENCLGNFIICPLGSVYEVVNQRRKIYYLSFGLEIQEFDCLGSLIGAAIGLEIEIWGFLGDLDFNFGFNTVFLLNPKILRDIGELDSSISEFVILSVILLLLLFLKYLSFIS